jgi:hypothetical protein
MVAGFMLLAACAARLAAKRQAASKDSRKHLLLKDTITAGYQMANRLIFKRSA